jgi:SAM-dependent methyltransferase
MLQAEFDRFADEYRADHAHNIRISGEDPEFFASYKVADIRRAIDPAAHSKPLKILDFGAGVGNSIGPFRHYFPTSELVCLDVSERSLDIAKRRFPHDAAFQAFDGQRIPFDDDGFDLVFAACVFHHIPQPLQPGLLREILRVLRKGGHFFLFEHNPLNPLTLRAVNTCPFDENAVLIRAGTMSARMRDAGFAQADVAYRVFFPRLLSWLRRLERFLGMVPLGAQYSVHARKASL